MVSTIDPLIRDAQQARTPFTEPLVAAAAVIDLPKTFEVPKPPEAPLAEAAALKPVEPTPPPPAPEIDAERVRAAVTLALDAALPVLIQEITERVLIALGH